MSRASGQNYSYRAAGVDIDAGNKLVERLKPIAAATARTGADGALGGFGGLFDLAACGYRDPLLVAATDGVGTKLLLAEESGRFDGIGIDLVAMCVNDLVVCGAEPLFFLDYYATGRLDLENAARVIEGIGAGCREAGCALIGGETAELPGLYRPGSFDLAGFAVGAVERDAVLDGRAIVPGDRLLGLAASGVHSNGFSLVRHIVADRALDLAAPAPFDATLPLGEALLTPTRIYVKAARAALSEPGVKAFAHITGGGLIENLPRALPKSVAAEIDAGSWRPPAIFPWLMHDAGVAPDEMLRTFNCGIGMVVVVAAERRVAIAAALAAAGETVFEIGTIIDRPTSGRAVEIKAFDGAWPR